ncbi:hypothetical protein KC571_00830 [candidate division WWE3 bacterium]|uniref:Uncharacterized protein n=1 Tax=candidate division WWE3 bacterium TaxID=2053526 RepID=A0A955LG81_UNCKA|nr:hypothetical protein [candidate division WWE3 bacterium]
MGYDDLFEKIRRIHDDCHTLCQHAFGRYYPVSGNVGIFCQSEEEYKSLTQLRERFTEPSDNPNRKYFKLIEPITVLTEDSIPEANYTYLYIRQPDPSPYGNHTGDIDFILEQDDYDELKKRIKQNPVAGVQMYDRPGWDTLQITNPAIDAVAYISTLEMAEKARIKFD